LRNGDSTIRCQWSGRPRSAYADDVDSVNELILSQKGAPKSHWTTRQIARKTGIHHSLL